MNFDSIFHGLHSLSKILKYESWNTNNCLEKQTMVQTLPCKNFLLRFQTVKIPKVFWTLLRWWCTESWFFETILKLFEIFRVIFPSYHLRLWKHKNVVRVLMERTPKRTAIRIFSQNSSAHSWRSHCFPWFYHVFHQNVDIFSLCRVPTLLWIFISSIPSKIYLDVRANMLHIN